MANGTTINCEAHKKVLRFAQLSIDQFRALEDATLVESLEFYFLNFQEPLMNYLIFELNASRSEAEDTFQEAMKQIAAIWPINIVEPQAWKYFKTTVRRCHLNMDRSKKTKKRQGNNLSIAQPGEAPAPGTISITSLAINAPSPERYLESKEKINLVKQHLHLIPDRSRQMFVHFYFNSFSYTEIAVMYNVTEATVRSHVSNARHILAKALADLL